MARDEGMPVDVRLDLAPHRIRATGAGSYQAPGMDTDLLQDLHALSHGKGDTFQHSSYKVGSGVVSTQPHPRAPRQRVEVGCALTGEIGQEEQPPGSGRNPCGCFYQGICEIRPGHLDRWLC